MFKITALVMKFQFTVVALGMLAHTCSCSKGSVSPLALSALHDLYSSTDGVTWSWRTYPGSGEVWNFSVPEPTPCFPLWQGLTCSCGSETKPCNITELILPQYDMDGTIPRSISNLTELIKLSLTTNELRGTIPDSIWSMTQLQHLNLDDNHFRGAFLADMTKMKPLVALLTLNLSFNYLDGTIPDTIDDLVHLKELDISSNFYVGTIPPSVGSLINLTKLHLYDNDLNGTMPTDLCQLHLVREFWLNDNDLSGSIPDCIGDLSSLVNMDVQNNYLNGSVPESIQLLNQTLNVLSLYRNQLTGSLPAYIFSGSLVTVFIDDNYFTGPLPEIRLPRLLDFFIANNHFSGSISPSLTDSTYLLYLEVSYNQIEGPLPSGFGDLVVLYFADFSYNQLTGPIPESIVSRFPMSHYQIDFNQMTGTIPTSLCVTEVEYLDLGANYFTGTIPDCFTRLVAFAVNHNILTGSLPSLNSSYNLQYFYAQVNAFQGRLELYSNTSLSYVDVSNNQFSGPLPTNFFNPFVNLVSFAATSNCISGSIPEEICSVKSLVFLDLDGLSTAPQCRSRILPSFPEFKSFTLPNQIVGGIPQCLFSMSTLQTLHLSGNSIEWSFPEDGEAFAIGGNLTELSLSHNKLKGAIPKVIQNRQWSTIDLSFNKLVGTVSFVEQDSANASLVLQVNRLSGPIPSSLVGLKSINMLTGNLFQCDLHRTGLPVHDAAYGTYQCGSNSFNQASIVWIVCACVMVLFLTVLWLYRSHWWEKIVNWCIEKWELLEKCYSIYNDRDDELALFKAVMLTLKKYSVLLALFILVVFLPVYSALTHFYKTVEYQYAWTVSAAFLSGINPAMVLLSLYLVTIILLVSVRFVVPRIEISVAEPVAAQSAVHHFDYVQIVSLLVVVLVNCSIMISVNALYVLIILHYNTQVIFCAQISVALFKLLWNDFAVRGMLLLARTFYVHDKSKRNKEKQIVEEMPYMTFIILFNSIIAPCLATAAVDSNCFYNVFSAPAAVSSEFPYFNVVGGCDYTIGDATGNVQCIQGTKESFVEVSYDPPFIYSYQCSSSMLTNYASVYVFMFLVVAFVKPVALYLMQKCYTKIPEQSCMFVLIDRTMYRLLKPASIRDLETGKTLFHKERFALRMIAKVAVLITFGVIFPPLAVVVCFAFVSEIYLNVLIVGSFLVELSDLELRSRFRTLLCRDCKGSLELLLIPVVRLVVPFAAIFYAFFVFDIYGDSVGFRRSVWASILLCVFPMVLWVGFFVSDGIAARRRFLSRKHTVTVGAEMMSVNELHARKESFEL